MTLNLKLLIATMAIAVSPIASVSASSISTVPANGDRQLTRAEVLADLEMWKRAGLQKLHEGGETPDTFSSEYRSAYAEYIRMRNGTEYKQELQRQQEKRRS